MISFDDFAKVELRTAHIISAEAVEGSEKLVKLMINAGDVDEAGAPVSRQILAGIRKAYEPETLVGRNIVIVANLEPRKLMGEESNGMLLAATDPDDGIPILLMPERDIKPGSKIR
ncbi:MAG: methionine--tRNA ligase subunit beta [bacterium]|nr:methionine--tRNA ligase subunit beta [Candidatus Jorgensenbacteria bacterium]